MQPLYNKPTREVLQEGLVDLDCQVKEFTFQPGKKAVKVLHRRINPDRAASRALVYCGTNPKL